MPLTASVAAQSSIRPDRRIALSFDDLPVTGEFTCDTAYVRNVTARITGVLKARSLPAAALASPGRRCVDPDLLRETLSRWQEAGAVIGNHTATHPDLNGTSIDAYLADIARAQELIDAAVRTEGRWFRPPLLHSGEDRRKKDALAAYLAEHGNRVAPVTIDIRSGCTRRCMRTRGGAETRRSLGA